MIRKVKILKSKMKFSYTAFLHKVPRLSRKKHLWNTSFFPELPSNDLSRDIKAVSELYGQKQCFTCKSRRTYERILFTIANIRKCRSTRALTFVTIWCKGVSDNYFRIYKKKTPNMNRLTRQCAIPNV
jgi:hypothetical protein